MRLREINLGCLGGGTGLPSLLGGLKLPYFAVMLAVAAHFGWQIATLKPNDQADCLAKFKANAGIGWLLLLAMVVGHLH